MKIIVGLGNPGKEYEKTRHNAGFMAIDKVADRLGISFDQSKFKALIASSRVAGEMLLLVKPQTYMNLSGESVNEALRFYKCDISDLLVLVDDLDLPVGRIRIRSNGSDGGQRGLRSIIQHIGTKEFSRIRIGIDNNKLMDTKDYVLGKIPKEQQEAFNQALMLASNAAYDFSTMDTKMLMNKYNTHGGI